MRIAWLEDGAATGLALVEPDAGRLWPTGVASPLADLIAQRRLAGLRPAPGVAPLPLAGARLGPPIVPRLIVGVGLNYRAHAAEQGRALPQEPPLFLKNPRSLAGPFDPVPLSPMSPALDYEAELGIVIGRPLSGAAVSATEAEAAIAGFVVANDLTLRDLARPETLAIAKGGPAMAPIGPWLTTVESMPVARAADLAIGCDVNGEPRQDARTSDMHHGPVDLVRRIARHLPLGPGDLILSGSPGGSGAGFDPPRWLAAGDRVRCWIEGLGALSSPIVRNS